jgi:hypothetical protein
VRVGVKEGERERGREEERKRGRESKHDRERGRFWVRSWVIG